MVQCSNTFVIIFNFLMFVFSMPIFFIGIYMHHHATMECNQLWLHIPFIVLGFFLLIVSFIGLLAACYRSTCLFWLYLFAMLLLVILVSAMTIFAFIVMHNSAGGSEAGSEEGYKEYKVLGDHPNWFRNRINDTSTWNRIKSCLQTGRFCSHAQSNFLGDTFNIFNHEKLLSAELCCKPSDECKFVNQRANVWIKATNASYRNSDCDAWSDDSNILCYNCESCKAGLVKDLKKDLKVITIINVVFLFILLVVYSIGCCALKNNRRDSYNKNTKNVDH